MHEKQTIFGLRTMYDTFMHAVHSFSNIQTKWLKGKCSKTLLMHCYRTKWGSLYLFCTAFTGDNRLYDHRQTGRFPGGRCGGCFHFQALHWLWPTKWIYMQILLNVKNIQVWYVRTAILLVILVSDLNSFLYAVKILWQVLNFFFFVSFEHLLQIRSFVEYMSILCYLFQTVLNRRGWKLLCILQ